MFTACNSSSNLNSLYNDVVRWLFSGDKISEIIVEVLEAFDRALKVCLMFNL